MGCACSTGKTQPAQPVAAPATQAALDDVKPSEVVSDDAVTDVPADAAPVTDEASSSETDTTILTEIFEGVLKGFVNESLPAVESMVKDSVSVLSGLKTAVANLEKGEVDSVARGLVGIASAL